MRTTPSYFDQKEVIMQKLTTLDWVGENIRKNSKSAQKEYCQIYFYFESISDVESKIKKEGIVYGLTTMKDNTDMLEDHNWTVYKNKDPL